MPLLAGVRQVSERCQTGGLDVGSCDQVSDGRQTGVSVRQVSAGVGQVSVGCQTGARKVGSC